MAKSSGSGTHKRKKPDLRDTASSSAPKKKTRDSPSPQSSHTTLGSVSKSMSNSKSASSIKSGSAGKRRRMLLRRETMATSRQGAHMLHLNHQWAPGPGPRRMVLEPEPEWAVRGRHVWQPPVHLPRPPASVGSQSTVVVGPGTARTGETGNQRERSAKGTYSNDSNKSVSNKKKKYPHKVDK